MSLHKNLQVLLAAYRDPTVLRVEFVADYNTSLYSYIFRLQYLGFYSMAEQTELLNFVNKYAPKNICVGKNFGRDWQLDWLNFVGQKATNGVDTA